MAEFEMIQQYFKSNTRSRDDVIIGIGDDAAVVATKPNQDLLLTMDTLVEGIHFNKNDNPYDLGYKSLAVNLSDLAAMGATPAWIMLALTLPHDNHSWLQKFSDGLFALANQFNVSLIGGDLTQGPLTITIQATGYAPKQQALLRSAAKPGDLIYVSGTLGDAALALHLLNRNEPANSYLLKRLHHPEPRVKLGEHLRGIANAVIDVSDGFATDLSHILTESQVGADIDIDQLPLSATLIQSTTPEDAMHYALTGGDDYELCFTIPPEHKDAVINLSKQLDITLTPVGIITDTKTLILHYHNGTPYHGPTQGYQHF